jgi:hypothetical protein
MPVLVPAIEFGDSIPTEFSGLVPHDYAFGLLDRSLSDLDLKLWVMFDRLDEAFQGVPDVEVPALRALFRTYLDLLPYERVKLKLFVRRDLFRRIVEGGFVNLTHINARRIDITWDSNDLWDLLFRRINDSTHFIESASLVDSSPDEVWKQLAPLQVDTGKRKPETWNWMMLRIRDGNDVRPPRNLIDLIRDIRDVQMRRDEQTGREFAVGVPLLTSESIKKGLSRLSDNRVQDTLLAEAGASAKWIESFRGGKAEHNMHSLGVALNLEGEDLSSAVKSLQEFGFLEKIGETYKVPSLYRDGLGITQGKAFDAGPASPGDEEDE